MRLIIEKLRVFGVWALAAIGVLFGAMSWVRGKQIEHMRRAKENLEEEMQANDQIARAEQFEAVQKARAEEIEKGGSDESDSDIGSGTYTL